MWALFNVMGIWGLNFLGAFWDDIVLTYLASSVADTFGVDEGGDAMSEFYEAYPSFKIALYVKSR